MKNKSFTLIELLVVIAIIGLLLSVVLVSMAGIRQKAKLAKTLEFSQSLSHALGAYALGIWNFDDQTNPTKDGSGYGNNGTISGGASYTIETPQKAAGIGAGKYALSFDGVDDYVRVPHNAVFNFGANGDFTWELWINSGLSSNIRLLYKGSQWAIMVPDGSGKFWARLRQDASNLAEIKSSATISPLAWYHLVVSRGGSSLEMYINGVRETNPAITVTGAGINSNIDSATDVYFASEGGTVNYWKGLIDEVRIYERALTLGEIQKHYAEGLEKHQNFVIK